MSLHIYIDAEACPVREETYKVARRHAVPLRVVTNSYSPPREVLVAFQLIMDGFDATNDWIAEHANADAIVITSTSC